MRGCVVRGVSWSALENGWLPKLKFENASNGFLVNEYWSMNIEF